MKDKDYIEVRVDVKDAEIVEKLDVLRLERGISSNSFILKAITEKLIRDGYLHGGAKPHQTKEKELSEVEQLQRSLRKIAMRRP